MCHDKVSTNYGRIRIICNEAKAGREVGPERPLIEEKCTVLGPKHFCEKFPCPGVRGGQRPLGQSKF